MRVTTDRINSGPHRPRRYFSPSIPSEDDVPVGTIADVMEWVGENAERAERALAFEHEHSARPTLIKALEGVLEAATAPQTAPEGVGGGEAPEADVEGVDGAPETSEPDGDADEDSAEGQTSDEG